MSSMDLTTSDEEDDDDLDNVIYVRDAPLRVGVRSPVARECIPVIPS